SLDTPTLQLYLYQLAFAEGDTAAMAKHAAAVAGKAGIEDQILENESLTAAYYGHLRKSRDLAHHAVESARHSDYPESGASYAALPALHEALLGNLNEAKGEAASALASSSGTNIEYPAALAFAVTGDTARAQSLAAALAKHSATDTIANSQY